MHHVPHSSRHLLYRFVAHLAMITAGKTTLAIVVAYLLGLWQVRWKKDDVITTPPTSI